MFQIGRSSEPSIDFIVLDTHVTSPNASPESSLQVPNNPNNQLNNPQSTISRFSCRILVDREYPYTARIYAAGFDSSKSIFLGVVNSFFFLKIIRLSCVHFQIQLGKGNQMEERKRRNRWRYNKRCINNASDRQFHRRRELRWRMDGS